MPVFYPNGNPAAALRLGAAARLQYSRSQLPWLAEGSAPTGRLCTDFPYSAHLPKAARSHPLSSQSVGPSSSGLGLSSAIGVMALSRTRLSIACVAIDQVQVEIDQVMPVVFASGRRVGPAMQPVCCAVFLCSRFLIRFRCTALGTPSGVASLGCSPHAAPSWKPGCNRLPRDCRAAIGGYGSPSGRLHPSNPNRPAGFFPAERLRTGCGYSIIKVLSSRGCYRPTPSVAGHACCPDICGASIWDAPSLGAPSYWPLPKRRRRLQRRRAGRDQ